MDKCGMTIDTSKLQASTKKLMGLVVTAGTLFQIPAVHDFVLVQVHNHPHMAGVIATLTAIAGLLHNPQVMDVLGFKRTVEVKDEEVSVKSAD
jgi:hypothetical protein